MTYQLQLLGRFQLLSPSGDGITISSKKNQALIALLALAEGEPVPRSRLTGVLWGDRGEDQARSSLRQAFTALRKVFDGAGPFPFEVDDDQASIDPDGIDTDALRFAETSRNGSPGALARADSLYRGEFLDGLSISGQAVQDWLLDERQRFQSLYTDNLSRLITSQEEAGDFDQALAGARRLLKVDPLHEPAHRAVMRALAGKGDRVAAVQQFQTCRDLLKGELGIEPDRQTRQLYETIRESVLVQSAGGAEAAGESPRAGGTDKPIVAVLPFVSLSDDESGQLFADGVTRELITELGRFSSLSLAAAATMFAYKGKQVGAAELGRELCAAYVLEGSIQTSGETIRVTAQLTAAESGTQIWADRIDVGGGDPFAAQDEIIRRISSNLYQPLLTDGYRRAGRTAVADAGAYDLYMDALGHIDKPTRAGVRRARDACQRALRIDPSFALTYEALMWTHLHEAWNGWTEDPQAALQAARREVALGVTVDERDPFLRGSLGFIDVLLGNRERGLEALRTNIDLVPSDHIYYTLFGGALSFAGDAEQALAVLEQAERMSPGYHVIRLFQGDANYHLGNFEQAISAYEAFLDVLPEFNWALAHLAACHVELGRIEPAREIVERIQTQSEYMTQDYLRQLLQKRDPAVVERLVNALDQAGLPRNHASAPSEKPSIAVLPFENLSGDPGQEYFSDGLTEDIITQLSRFRDLFVIASHSCFAYKGKAVKIPDVSRELGVRYILEGSVQRSDDRVRISVQLIDGHGGHHLWTERYDRRLDDIFELQDEVTETIVGTLASGYGGRLRKAWQSRAQGSRPQSAQAFDCFMRGLDAVDEFTKEGNQRGRELFEEALALDPTYARALGKLAWTYLLDAIEGWVDDYQGSLAKGLELATKAIACDDGESWAHWPLAAYYLYTSQHDLAESEFQKATTLNPNDADVLIDAAWCQSYAGRPEEALKTAERAMRLNPHHPEWYLAELLQIYYDARRYQDAVATFERLRSYDTTLARLYLAASHAALGQDREARRAMERALELDPEATLRKWASVKMAPYKDPKDLAHFRDNLVKAGLPE